MWLATSFRRAGHAAKRSLAPASCALLVSANGSASAPALAGLPAWAQVRTLRGSRLTRHRAAQKAYEEELLRELKKAKKKADRAARPPPPPPPVPSHIRVRELAKILKKPVDEVIKKVVVKKNRRYHMQLGRERFEFKNVKQIILPYQLAEEVAAAFEQQISYEDLEPVFFKNPQRTSEAVQPDHVMQRNPVIAVMGHVDHGKTTLMDTLRESSIAKHEAHGITQKINICEATLSPKLHATFLDTPGHFHFFRMRNNAAQVADLVLLIVAADEGCLLQTEESIGAIEESNIPVIACINKIDIATRSQIDSVREDLRSFVALQTCPIIEIAGSTGENFDSLTREIEAIVESPAVERKLEAYVGPDVPAQGLVLESIVMKGRGTVLRVLLKAGVLKKQDHFVAGMIHGVVRSVRNADSGKELGHAVPGMVVDVLFGNKSKNVDAPIEFGFFVLPEAHAKQVLEQRELALELSEAAIPMDDEEEDDESGVVEGAVDEDYVPAGYVEDDSSTKPIIVKADGAGSLTSIQDTVDEMKGISTVRIGIGHISVRDIDAAINQSCPIFGFNVKLHKRERVLAAKRGVRVVLRSTIHGLIEEIEQFSAASKE